ncbi:MAG TPA: patatin-like phospholipase family protein, partial [Candidatus Udaeobacter sp.]|nr:patatin-like phospholipase family protein [Candidatus Udaeobacter sp.]
MTRPSRRLRADLPFRRIAVVLSGGGGVGAYEVGVFRALEHAGFQPSIILGVSVGAINALIWVAHGFRSESLRRVWRRLRPPSVGIRWVTLAARSLGVFLLTLAAFEALLTLADVPELRLGRWVGAGGPDLPLGWRDMLFDVLAWTVVATLGGALMINSDRFEDFLARLTPPADPERIPRLFGWLLLALALLFPLSFLFSFPWPRRFHLVLVLFGALVWLGGNRLRRGGSLRRLVMRTFPETGGRGLWRSAARRRLIDGLMPKQVQ